MAAEGSTALHAPAADDPASRKRRAESPAPRGNGTGSAAAAAPAAAFAAPAPARTAPPANGRAAAEEEAATEAVVSGGGAVGDELVPVESEAVQQVQRRWQMCSCVHFFSSFKGVLPLAAIAPATAAALNPLLLERAVAEPAEDALYSVVYRDLMAALLVALKELAPKYATDRWFPVLTKLVNLRSAEFPDCFEGPVRGGAGSVLEQFGTEGMNFVFCASWKVRLGLLHGLCDIVAEEAECMRDVIKEAERLSTATRHEVEARHYRLLPLGRCSKKRFYYCVGGCRIYSGFKRKGSGGVVVECSDVPSMRNLVAALEASETPKDAALGAKIRSWYLGPLLESEDKKRKKIDRDLAVEAQREESRRRNADRPRRARASYNA